MLAGVRERGEADNIFLCVRYIQGIYWRLQLIIVLIFPTILSLAEQIVILVLLYSCFQYSVFSIGRMELYAFKISFIRFF